MGGTKYAKAVAAIKAMENFFLTHSDIEQLINASGKAEMNSILASKKSGGAETDSLESVWNTLMDYAPECQELKILLYKNDFHNLKAALKSMISGREPDKYYIKPSNLNFESLKEILSSKEYERLPEYMRKTAEEAYKLITKTLDGQLADSLIDCDTLKALQTAAEKTKSSFMIEYALLNTVCADIKTAYRCCKMKKSMSFTETALCG
ncbi:MAG: V-type ATPase subunit, partial [Ruminococcus sp.]|nr:V-type ATPase subunit [Ruminococcus sp.]